MTMEQEVALLFPEGKKVKLGDQELTIMPFGFGKFPKVMKVLERIVESLPKEKGVQELNAASLVDIIAANGDNAMELCKLATGKDDKFFDALAMDEGIDLLLAIVEVNKDFFTVRLLPKMTAAVENLSASLGSVSSQP